MDAPGPGGLGGTFAGNPLSCAAALAVLDIFERENLLERANELGNRFQKRVREDRKSTRLNSSHTVISYAVFCLKKKIQARYLRMVTAADTQREGGLEPLMTRAES